MKKRIVIDSSSEETDPLMMDDTAKKHIKKRKIILPEVKELFPSCNEDDLNEMRVLTDADKDVQVFGDENQSSTSEDEEEIPDIDTQSENVRLSRWEQHKLKEKNRQSLRRQLLEETEKVRIRMNDAEKHRERIRNETGDQSQSRRDRDSAWKRASREAENAEIRQARLERDNQSRRKKALSFQNAAFEYGPDTDVSRIQKELDIGRMSETCQICGAKKWKKETAGFCCGNGKIDPPKIQDPPEPLKEMMEGKTPKSKKFKKSIRTYNCAFQCCSFKAKQIKQKGFQGSFKIQGQIYHQMGALEPSREKDEKFIQIYFIKNLEDQTDRRCNVIQNLDREVVQDLQGMLHRHNHLIREFKTALENENLSDDVSTERKIFPEP